MTYRISKEFHFSASHVLDGLPAGHQCGRMHGHNYVIVVELEADKLDDVGFVYDYGDLAFVKDLIDRRLDHRHLNDTIAANPTAEVLAELLWMHVVEHGLPDHVRCSAVGVRETPKTYAEFQAMTDTAYKTEALDMLRSAADNLQLPPVDIIVEVGGGDGVLTSGLLQWTSADLIVTYEPHPHTAARLARRFLHDRRVDVRAAAVTAQRDPSPFFMSATEPWASSYVQSPYQPYDETQIVVPHVGPEVLDADMVVLDCEGTEVELLPHVAAGAARCLMVEVHADRIAAVSYAQLEQVLEPHGWETVDRRPSLVALPGVPTHVSDRNYWLLARRHP